MQRLDDSDHPFNRHLVISDNYKLLRNLESESIDLICTDPPFAKNDTFVGSLTPPLFDSEIATEKAALASWGVHQPSDAANAGIVWPTGEASATFADMWSWENDVHEEWVDQIESQHPAIARVIDATRHTHSESLAAYMAYMAIRLIECHRVLKPTGSFYLHCDHTANAYLRLLLDAIFGYSNLRTEVIWRIGWVSGYKTQKKGWIRNHDTILYYVKTPAAAVGFNKEYLPYPDGYVRRDGKLPTGKGFPVEDTWNCHSGDVLNSIKIMSFSKEKSGYPTQKPVMLAERIIKASSNVGDVVFDPFAGCAYVPVAAERLGRQWFACDISPRAMTVLRRQFAKFHYAVDGQIWLEGRPADQLKGHLVGQSELALEANVIICGPNEIPERSFGDEEESMALPDLPEREYKIPASKIPNREMLNVLLDMSGWRAWCCGFANIRTLSGDKSEIVKSTNNFHLDHIDPKSKSGSNQITNRAPLCQYHNISKGNRRIHLDDYRREIVEKGELLVPSIDYLVDLAEAHQKSLDYYAQHPSNIQMTLRFG